MQRLGSRSLNEILLLVPYERLFCDSSHELARIHTFLGLDALPEWFLTHAARELPDPPPFELATDTQLEELRTYSKHAGDPLAEWCLSSEPLTSLPTPENVESDSTVTQQQQQAGDAVAASGEPYAIATLLYGNNPYFLDCVVLGYSLQRHAAHLQRIVLCTNTVSDACRKVLEEIYTRVIVVEDVEVHPTYLPMFSKSRWGGVFNKLHVLLLEEYTKVSCIDAGAHPLAYRTFVAGFVSR
jgi:hypothetical protein